MPYNKTTFQAGVTKVTSAWQNKIEGEMQRIGTFLGVYDSIEELPGGQTDDWAIVGREIYIYTTQWEPLLQIDWNNITNKPTEFRLNPNTYYPRETYQYWIRGLKSIINDVRPRGAADAYVDEQANAIHDSNNEFYAQVSANATPFAAWAFQFPAPDGKFVVDLPASDAFTYAYWINLQQQIGTLLYLGDATNGYSVKVNMSSGYYTLELEMRDNGDVTTYIETFPMIFFKYWNFLVFEVDNDIGYIRVFFSGHQVLEASVENVPYKEVYFSGEPGNPHPWIISCPMIIKGNLPWTEEDMKEIVARAQPLI